MIFSLADFADILAMTVRTRAKVFIKRNIYDRAVISIFPSQGDKKVCVFMFLT